MMTSLSHYIIIILKKKKKKALLRTDVEQMFTWPTIQVQRVKLLRGSTQAWLLSVVHSLILPQNHS